jgi:hypothetical protein
LERPVGELEAICGQQHGTEHNVPIRWTPPQTATEWEAEKHSPNDRPRLRLTVGAAIFALALVVIAVYAITRAVP